jgi:hypothetical protein
MRRNASSKAVSAAWGASMGTRALLEFFVLICSDPRMLDGFGTARPIPGDQVCRMLESCLQTGLR